MSEIKGVNLIIDSNYILYRSVFWLHKTNTLYGDLEKSLEIAFNNYINLYPFKKIYVVSDTKNSWRKRFYKEYKGTREKLLDIDWEFVYNTFSKFKEGLVNSKKRVIQLEGENIEGDDWIYYLVKQSNKSHISTITIASDKDINQLLEFRLNEGWINIQWADSFKNGKVYLPQSYALFLEMIKSSGGNDLFSTNENHDFLNLFNDFLEKYTSEEIDKEKSLFIKLISGDTGDNIQSVLKVPTKTNPDKFQGIGEAGGIKIWNSFKNDYLEDIDFENDEWIENVIPYIIKYKKIDVDNTELNKIELKVSTNLKFNRKLVHLHENHLPIDIKNTIEKLLK